MIIYVYDQFTPYSVKLPILFVLLRKAELQRIYFFFEFEQCYMAPNFCGTKILHKTIYVK